jgi:hypothetical protein
VPAATDGFFSWPVANGSTAASFRGHRCRGSTVWGFFQLENHHIHHGRPIAGKAKHYPMPAAMTSDEIGLASCTAYDAGR